MKKIFIILVLLTFCSLIFSLSTDIDRAIKLINEGNYDEAIKLLESSGESNDILLAIAYIGKKDFQTAKIFALQYWLQNENNVLANYILALICEELKDYETAIFYWNGVYKNTKNSSLKQLAKKHIEVLQKLIKG